jgi:hypothetical protein
VDLDTRLPTVKEFVLRPWHQSFGGDYYGAIQLAAEYCGLGNIPPCFPGSWQHGVMPPWWQIPAEVVVYDAPTSARCFVARQDEATSLKAAGYRTAQAIGLPIIYTQSSGSQRMPNSLLVMPTHSLPSDVLAAANEQYVREIASIKNKFDLVVACVSPYCIDKGLWISHFKEKGIPVIRGAGIADANALKRMRALFESFEYVTTDSYGSHVFYALYFGAKVSIWGEATPVLRENVLSDGGWTRYPEAVDKLLSEETRRMGEVYLAPLRVDPWIGAHGVDLSKTILGHDNKLSPAEMRAAFGWTPLRILVDSAVDIVRASPVWRAGSAAKRGLLTTAKFRGR